MPNFFLSTFFCSLYNQNIFERDAVVDFHSQYVFLNLRFHVIRANVENWSEEKRTKHIHISKMVFSLQIIFKSNETFSWVILYSFFIFSFFAYFFTTNDNDYLPFFRPCISFGLNSYSNQFADFILHTEYFFHSSLFLAPTLPMYKGHIYTVFLFLHPAHIFGWSSIFTQFYCYSSHHPKSSHWKIYSNVIQRIRVDWMINIRLSSRHSRKRETIWYVNQVYNAKTNTTAQNEKYTICICMYIESHPKKHMRLRISMTSSENIYA